MQILNSYDEYWVSFPSEEEANDMLSKMMKDIKEKGFLTINDFLKKCGLVKVPPDSKLDNTGWDDLDSASCSLDKGKYILNLPEPKGRDEMSENDTEEPKKEQLKSISTVINTPCFKLFNDDNSDPDMVNHPPHYMSDSGLEVIQVIEVFTDGLNGIEATDTGNIIKYACRWKDKNGIEDLKKLVWYANHLIGYLENKEKEKRNEK